MASGIRKRRKTDKTTTSLQHDITHFVLSKFDDPRLSWNTIVQYLTKEECRQVLFSAHYKAHEELFLGRGMSENFGVVHKILTCIKKGDDLESVQRTIEMCFDVYVKFCAYRFSLVGLEFWVPSRDCWGVKEMLNFRRLWVHNVSRLENAFPACFGLFLEFQEFGLELDLCSFPRKLREEVFYQHVVEEMSTEEQEKAQKVLERMYFSEYVMGRSTSTVRFNLLTQIRNDMVRAQLVRIIFSYPSFVKSHDHTFEVLSSHFLFCFNKVDEGVLLSFLQAFYASGEKTYPKLLCVLHSLVSETAWWCFDEGGRRARILRFLSSLLESMLYLTSWTLRACPAGEIHSVIRFIKFLSRECKFDVSKEDWAFGHIALTRMLVLDVPVSDFAEFKKEFGVTKVSSVVHQEISKCKADKTSALAERIREVFRLGLIVCE